MLIKEYRIPLPLTVEEYRIAQLFMIAKKSREESKGQGSGVEILVNEPYTDGPGGSGQYTHKIYHVGSHLPGWFKSLLPKSALTVEEEAWNAYPYTKTRYTCPFVEKFLLEIETYYFADNGHQENVFRLTGGDLRNRVVDLIDVVKDQLYGADYLRDEDPKVYVSQKTGRGPLADSWLDDYWRECQGRDMPLPNGKSIMCAYKLCRVEFRYWGMQTKLEKFIHDVALRKTMVRAHRQAWAWQDEWHGLTMDDIRAIERQTQEALKRKMGAGDGDGEDADEADAPADADPSATAATPDDDAAGVAKTLQATLGSIEKPEADVASPPATKRTPASPPPPDARDASDASDEEEQRTAESLPPDTVVRFRGSVGEVCTVASAAGAAGGGGALRGAREARRLWSRSGSRGALHSPAPGTASAPPLELHVANWRMESIVRDSDDDASDDDDEFFDCQEDLGESSSLAKWSSLDLLTEEDTDATTPTVPDRQGFQHFFH